MRDRRTPLNVKLASRPLEKLMGVGFYASTQLARRTIARSIAGGNIRSIALNAAFLAAEAGETLQMKHVLEAARGEHIKIEKPLTDVEVRGWM